jgi:alpha-N-arabinofuranosidase
VHQDATLLPSELQSADYEFEGKKLPGVSVSSSRDKDGHIHVTLCNLNPNAAAEVQVDLQGAEVGQLSGRVLTAEAMNAHNTFEQPDAVKPASFSDFQKTGNGFTTTLPPKSVVVLSLN